MAAMLLCQSASGQSRSSRLPLSSGNAPDGVLEPWKISEVGCVESGLIEQIQANLGARVHVGDALASIESAALRQQLKIAEVQAASMGRLNSVKAELELNERRVAALTAARENRFSSQSELERAQADLKITRGQLAAEIEEREVMRLQVERLKLQLEQRTIVAPIDGIVVEFHKEVGEFVSPTSPEVLRIVDVSRLRASFFLQVSEVQDLPPSRVVQVRLNDGSQTAATIEIVSPVADGESGLIEVRVLIENPAQKILGSRCALLLSELDQVPPST